MKSHPFSKTLIKRAALLETALGRREFLKSQLTGVLALTAGAAGLYWPKPARATGAPDIAVAEGKPGPATRAAVELLGGMEAFIKPGSTVVIKPNMSFANNTEAATTTNPLVTRELVAMCKEAGASRIRVLDHPLAQAELCMRPTREALRVFDEDMVFGLMNKDLYKPVPIPKGLNFKETDVMRDVLECDVLIAAPVAKSHHVAGVSLCMKGMMGLIWNRQVMHADYDLDASIVDLCSLLKPNLAVVDATRVLSSGGPYGPGKVLKTDTVIASKDMVAADAQTVQMFKWYGQRFAPRQVDHIRMAHERGLGRMDLAKLYIKRIKA